MRARLLPGLLALLVCVAMVGLHAYTGEFERVSVTRVQLGKPGRLYDTTVTVNSSAIGQVLYQNTSFQGRSGALYLAVNVTLVTDGLEQSHNWKVGGVSNGRTFRPLDPLFVPQPGFTRTQDIVFELSPDDLAGFTVTFLNRAPIYAFDPQLNVDLEITPATASEWLERDRYGTLETTRGADEVTR